MGTQPTLSSSFVLLRASHPDQTRVNNSSASARFLPHHLRLHTSCKNLAEEHAKDVPSARLFTRKVPHLVPFGPGTVILSVTSWSDQQNKRVVSSSHLPFLSLLLPAVFELMRKG